VKPLLVSLILSAVAGPAFAAPFDRFLGSAWSDHKVSLQQKNQRDYGDSSGFRPIEGMELRFSQNEVIDDRTYALRVKPRGLTQDRLLSSLSKGQNRIEALNLQVATTQALLERYMAAAQYAVAFETHRLWSSIASLRAKRLSMLQIAARSSQTRASDLIKQRGDVEQSEIKASLAESELKTAVLRMKALDPSFKETASDLNLNLKSMPTPVEMLRVVNDTPEAEASIETKLARENATRAADSLKYEIAKDDRLINFFELRYDEDKVDKQRAWGFRVGLNIPGFASSEHNRSEKARTLVKYEVEAREAARSEALAQAEAKQALTLSADLYKSLASLGDRPSEKRMRRAVSAQDPLLGLTLQEEGFVREVRQHEVALKAYESYFNYLAASGALASRSRTNFLSRDLKEIP
jgi:hypothetical protein